jgi:arylsulfatase A-like enzyme
MDRVTSLQKSARWQGYQDRLGPLTVLMLSVWCGLVAGLLEVASRVVCRAVDPTHELYMMSRHFVWLAPLANMLVFLGLGLFLAGITRFWPRPGGWLSTRLLSALTMVPMLMVAVPQIFPEAWFVLALGIASRLVSWLELQPTNLRPWLFRSFPGLLGLVLVLAGSVFGGDWLKQRREAGRALPPADSPNVLLIVLDTVRADRLSLYGYQRPTTPALERLAKRGVRFDAARATAPWTLPSHASFFTGRWPHELDVEWMTPLRKRFPMLAEYLGSHGYATAGVVANAGYCSYDTGLDRGFTHYEDYTLERLGFLRTAVLVEEVLRTVLIQDFNHEVGFLHSLRDLVQRWFYSGDRRDAAAINRGFVDWLARRPQQARPFFVFLNYMDAHTPYKLPEGARHRFGRKPQTQDELRIIYDRWSAIDKLRLPPHYLKLARDSYDNCLAYLDEQLGALFDELQSRGMLDKTLVVITADHGEGLGEHDLFEHGESLYNTEIRVPMLILPVSNSRSEGIVRETVSLRDLPATVVDLVGLGIGSPFPGQSLAPRWRDSSPGADRAASHPAVSELMRPSPNDPNQGRSPARRGPLISLAEDDFVYIRNEGDGTEELFNERDDPRELTNHARSDALKPVLERFRERVDRIKMSAPGSPR